MTSDQTHEGLQSPPDRKERKGLKEAHFALGPRPGSTVQPIRTPLEPAEQSPPRSRSPCRGPRQHPAPPLRSRVANLPSGKHANSARSRVTSLPSGKRINSVSLEATSRRKGQTAHPLTCPPHKGNKCRPLHLGVGGQTASGHHSAQWL